MLLIHLTLLSNVQTCNILEDDSTTSGRHDTVVLKQLWFCCRYDKQQHSCLDENGSTAKEKKTKKKFTLASGQTVKPRSLDLSANDAKPKAHSQVKSGNKMTKSVQGHQQTSQKNSYSTHNRGQTVKFKKNRCNICGKHFAQKAYLKQHSRVHTGEKPYKCTLCSTFFTFQSNYATHLRRAHTWKLSNLLKTFNCFGTSENVETGVFLFSIKILFTV